MPTLDEFFGGRLESRYLFDALLPEINSLGPMQMRVTKSQIAFSHKKTFAWVWLPEQYLHRKAAPLVLTLAFRQRDPSPRWKEIVEPYPGRFTHHLEINSVDDIDDEVRAWLQAAWQLAR